MVRVHRVRVLAQFTVGEEPSPAVRMILRTDRKYKYAVDFQHLARGTGGTTYLETEERAWEVYDDYVRKELYGQRMEASQV